MMRMEGYDAVLNEWVGSWHAMDTHDGGSGCML